MTDDSPDPRLRVVVVDDQALMRTGFRMILESADIDVVAEAENGRDAIAVVASTNPDVVLMDVRMPELDGVEATRRITESGSMSRVLILTTFDLDEYVYGALRAGAAGFLLKDTPPEKLIEAVRVVAAGEALLAPSVTRRLVEEFAARSPQATPVAGLDQLTDRETEVLEAMARGLSNAEIAEVLFVGETTVKTHVGRVLMKLGVRDRVQAVVAAYESGLIRPGQGSP
ncbi:MAG: response regulator transcription factor [Acidimicrobiales bacterium]